MSELELVVNGGGYNGWKAVRVVRSIETLAGSFTLDVSDRWGDQDEPWPIREEDSCRVDIVDGDERTTVIDGYIGQRRLAMTATSLSLSYAGKDRAAALVQCSMIVPGASEGGNKWVYRNIDIAEFTRAIASRFGITVSVQSGLVLPRDPLLVAHPGETGFEAIRRAAGSAGVLVISDGKGGILITRSGTGRATALVQGANVLTAEIEYDADERFHRYLIATQVPGTDDASGDATNIKAEATDAGVRRQDRVLIIRPDKGMDTAAARRRADWEARNRAALAAKAVVGVQGWRQPGGELWPINALTLCRIPRIGIDGDMLISQVEYTIGEGGELTQLHLVRPDAFEPEPQAVVSASQPWLISVGGELQEPGRR